MGAAATKRPFVRCQAHAFAQGDQSRGIPGQCSGDDCGAAAFVSGRAQDAFGAVLQRASSMRPFDRYEVITRARLGFQYLVKPRLHGKAGDLNLQNRWAADGDEWRIVEIEDLGLRSPWKKPEAIAAGAEKERAH